MLTGALPERVDYRKLASHAERLEGSIPVTRFRRFAALLAEPVGDVHVQLAFDREEHSRVSGAVDVDVRLVCQRCLLRFSRPLACRVSTLLVPDEAARDSLDRDVDAIVCREKTIALVDLVEDDLILGLPMIPRHRENECPRSDYRQGADTDIETHRPFAGLAQTMAKQNQPEH